MPVITVEASRSGTGADRERCRLLEEGNILVFPETSFELPDADRAFLLRQRQAGAGYHKNIAYRPRSDRVTGFVRQAPGDEERLRQVLRNHSARVIAFTAATLPAYAGRWRVDFASFRPQEEAGRRLSRRAQNDLLHVDAFPTRPTGGDRILRVFTNINPVEPRIWLTAESFERLAEQFAVSSGLLDRALQRGGAQRLRRLARGLGLPVAVRSPYDAFMTSFHNFMKENQGYQGTAKTERHSFPAGSTWIVFTDLVSHAVLAGRYALEQTFIVARDSLVLPDKAPISILERIAGARLA